MKLTFLKNDNYDIDEMEGKYSKFQNKNKILQKLKQKVKSDRLGLTSIKVNEVALSSYDDKRIQTLDCI